MCPRHCQDRSNETTTAGLSSCRAACVATRGAVAATRARQERACQRLAEKASPPSSCECNATRNSRPFRRGPGTGETGTSAFHRVDQRARTNSQPGRRACPAARACAGAHTPTVPTIGAKFRDIHHPGEIRAAWYGAGAHVGSASRAGDATSTFLEQRAPHSAATRIKAGQSIRPSAWPGSPKGGAVRWLR